MNILNALKQLRDDIKIWVTNNLNALNAKIDEKTIPIDSELDTSSTNPVQNKAIATEIADINSRVGDTPVATQISDAIAKQPHFSGDYNDLTNAPDIYEDGSGNMVIADESGNIIFSADADGIHTIAVTINGEKAATEKYVDETVAAIDIPETDFTGYAKESYVDEAISNIEFPETDLTGYATETYVDDKVADLVNSAPETLNTLGELAIALETHEDAYDALLETVGGKATHADLENLKNEISESIVSESDEFHIVDDIGNIVASIDENGIVTTTITAQNIIVNGDSVEEHIDNTNIHVTAAEKEAWNNKSNFSGSYNDLTDKPESADLSNYYTKTETDNAIESAKTLAANQAVVILGEAQKGISDEQTRAEAAEGDLCERIDTVETDLEINYYTKIETDTAIESAKEELSESIVSESEEWHIVDNNGNIVATIDASGISTTTVAAQNITINGIDIEELIQARVQSYIDQAILGGEW
jgi:tRNA A-37 threonylcarbamoyl transferase component Bud32